MVSFNEDAIVTPVLKDLIGDEARTFEQPNNTLLSSTDQHYYLISMSSAPTSPYTMCSIEECQDRQASKQVSVFECVDPKMFIQQRTMDHSLAVAKYRRSAAGTERAYPCRTMQQLEVTVEYLMQLILKRRSKPIFEEQSLLETVNFVEDRLVRCLQCKIELLRSVSLKAITLYDDTESRPSGFGSLANRVQAPGASHGEVPRPYSVSHGGLRGIPAQTW